MRVLAYDPFVPAERAVALGVELVEFDELLANCDAVTLHSTPTPGAGPLIGAPQLALMPAGALLVNTARGSLVDETALWSALETGRLGGAALDVFGVEPATENPLVGHPRVLATPHLGASTLEAQGRVSAELATEMLRVLRGEPAMQAVNAPFIDPETLEVVGPYLEVASMCGRLCTQLVRGQWRDVRVHYRGEIANHDVTPLKAAVVAGLLAPISDEHVNLVSVNNVIAHRGWRVAEETRPDAEPYQATVTVELTTSAGGISLTGTLEHGRAAVVEIDGLPVHIAGPRAGADHLHLLVLRNEDRPGRIGAVGGELGRRNVNIHAMDVGHDASDPSADALDGGHHRPRADAPMSSMRSPKSTASTRSTRPRCSSTAVLRLTLRRSCSRSARCSGSAGGVAQDPGPRAPNDQSSACRTTPVGSLGTK